MGIDGQVDDKSENHAQVGDLIDAYKLSLLLVLKNKTPQ